jgi:hypothetical protein
MPTYDAYGLKVSSPFDLFELQLSEGTPDVTIRMAGRHSWPAGFDAKEYWVDIGEQRARFWFKDVGSFEIRNGCEIDIHEEPGITPSALRLYVQGMILAALLHQRGATVLHASVVQIDGVTAAICGPVGAGKSSLAAAIAQAGRQVLSDDNAAVEFVAGRPLVASAYPFVKLYAEIATSLGFTANEIHSLNNVQRKVAGSVGRSFSRARPSLDRIYVLRKAGDPGIAPLSQAETAIELVRHSVPTRWGVPAGAEHFSRCVEIARRVPCWSLRTFDSIPEIREVAEIVIDHCSHAESQTTAFPPIRIESSAREALSFE